MSNTDSGHAKNTTNFQSLISICLGYGAAYNPSKPALGTAALNAQLTASETGLDQVQTQKTAYDNAINTRKLLFKPLKKLATRIINALAASIAIDATVEDAKSVNRKIQGTRSGKKPPPPAAPAVVGEAAATPEDNSISVSQQSFDNMVQHLAALIKIVAAEPGYVPNEAELSVAGLNTLLNNMRAANQAVINADTAYQNSRINRDKLLYDDPGGLVATALDVKKYVKSLFGATSRQYKQLSGINFKAL